MDFINDNEPNQIRVTHFGSLSCYDVPFFRGCYNDLRISDLLFRELTVAGQFGNLYTISPEPCTKISNLFLNECLERRNVNNLKVVKADLTSSGITVFADFTKNRQHCD